MSEKGSRTNTPSKAGSKKGSKAGTPKATPKGSKSNTPLPQAEETALVATNGEGEDLATCMFYY